ncbi:hypothetical protein QTO34_017828 [Cnephaeus nilssonii]|uniref:Homeobox domain-containing protein n=1 Tax=Cnephaeus nilssonii TaxID=3371016 RepID=A0AA40I1Q7_CNENI|nr:hypothetical protein QTO34_017828 [Eptesicus nilssonii]
MNVLVLEPNSTVCPLGRHPEKRSVGKECGLEDMTRLPARVFLTIYLFGVFVSFLQLSNMSVDSAYPQSLPCSESSDSREPSPVPEIYEPEENYASLQMSSAETLPTETAVSSLPSSMDLLIQNSPDSSTSPSSPSATLPTSVENRTGKEEKAQVKKQKIRTVFSQTQLCVLNERFQRQKYLSLQQMQELSSILNLSYKQIKTWFQNQRMKCKRWQKYNWPKNSHRMTQVTRNLFLLLFPYQWLSHELSSYGVPGPLLLSPGMPGERFWKPFHMEQRFLDQPILELPCLEWSDLVSPSLEQPGLEQPGLEQPIL